MVKCCGSNVATPYCPMCGKPTPGKESTRLLFHTQVQQKIQLGRAKATREQAAVYRKSDRLHEAVHNEKVAERQEQHAAKWGRWVELVQTWIARDEAEASEGR